MRTKIVHPPCDKTMTRSECEVGYGAGRLYVHLLHLSGLVRDGLSSAAGPAGTSK